MKILFILHLPPPVHGASVIGKYIKESITINSKFECRYLNLGTSGTISEIGRSSLNKLVRYFRIVLQVRKTLAEYQPDLCYLTPTAAGSGFYKDLMIIALVKIYCKKVLFHFHNKGIKEKQDKIPDKCLYRFAFRNTYIILLSPLLHGDVEKFTDEKRVYYCANGIPVPAKEVSFPTLKKSNIIELLFLSNLIISKGVLIFLEACFILKNKNIGFHGTIAGDDGDITYIEIDEYIKRKGLSSHITLHNALYGQPKINILESADIFVFPTYYPNECLPLSLIEAMQHSLPVVSTSEGAIEDLVEDGLTGFLVPKQNSSILADKIELLIKDSDLRIKMGAEGRKKYLKEFTLEKFENRMVEILEEVAGA
jgi:glycosyltransferase involved in cell wall biosynthesis